MPDPAPPAAPTVGPVRAIAAAIAPTTVGVLPSFLAGTVAVQMRADLGFGESELGLLFGAFFGLGAVSSAVLGRVAERLGPGRSLRLAATVAGADLLAVALVARSFPTLLLLLGLGGAANALAQPSANLWLTHHVAPERHGLAFGIKQSAIPAAMLLGGLAVPAIAIPIGWRWAFVAGAVLAAVAVAAVPNVPTPVRPVDEEPEPPPEALHLGPLLVLAGGIACGAAAAGTLGSFMVSAAVDAGVGEASAGLVFAAGAVVGLASRLWLGWRAARVGKGQLATVAVMMASGSVGYALLATGDATVIVAMTPIIFATGWGWPGLFNYSIVRHHPQAAGRATGITQTGTYIGAVTGPVVFGRAVEAWGYGPSWWLAAGLSLAAAAITLVGRSRLRSSIARRRVAVVPAA